jgi:two-component system sensor histidine kinase YesM
MRFRTRLIFTYSLLVTSLITLLALVFEVYNLRHLEEISRQNLDILSKNMSHQLDETVRPMNFITEFLLSDSRTLSAIATITRAERVLGTSPFITQAKQDLRISLSTYCNDLNFHRVNFFSESGDILSSNIITRTIADGSARPASIPGIGMADAAMGKPVLLPPYDDPWTPGNPQQVFSIVRLIMGNNISSYIEVQKGTDVLEDIFSLTENSAHQTAVIDSRGKVFFSQFSDAQNAALIRALADEPRLREQPLNHIEKNIAAFYYSPYTNTYTIVMQDRESMALAVRDVTLVTIVMALLISMVSIVLISILSIRVTLPIQRLITKMEDTHLDNLDREVSLEKSDDELVHLYQSYNNLLKRLNHARLREEQMELLHLQAEFDALQSQVNPHFLYNVLNVISHRGVINGDETICEICEKLAAMFRYSAGRAKRVVTIQEELEYMQYYLYLLKTRYHEKLVYSIETESEVMNQEIPKIVLQQLIENSVNHGYKNMTEKMVISIRAWTKDGFWYIEVKDNGSGFDEDIRGELEQKMAAITHSVKEGNLRFDIGGMGLLNMYARFLIIFGENVVFTLANHEHGAMVTIGALCANTEFKNV